MYDINIHVDNFEWISDKYMNQVSSSPCSDQPHFTDIFDKVWKSNLTFGISIVIVSLEYHYWHDVKQ